MFGGGQVDLAAAPQAVPVGHDVAVDAQPGDAAVGEDPQSDMRAGDRGTDREPIVRIAGQRSARQDLSPPRIAGTVLRQPDFRRQVRDVNRARFRVVALEMRGLDVDAAHDAGHAEPDDAPVVARLAAPAGLPPVHPLAPVGVLPFAPLRRLRPDEIVLRRKKLVVRRNHGGPEALRREIDQIEER